MYGEMTAPQFLQEFCLSQTVNLGSLTQGGFLADEQSYRQVQSSLARRQSRFDGFRQSQLHGERVNLISAFRKVGIDSEECIRSQGVQVEVLQDATCIQMMRDFYQ